MVKAFIGIMVCLAITCTAQTIHWEKNEMPSFIKKGDTLKIVYDYSKMKVDTFSSQELFIKSTVQKYNLKEPGRGDKWKSDWFSDRVNMFQPRFETLFRKYLQKKMAYCVNCQNADFVVVVRTTRTYLGYSNHLIYSMFSWAAECDFEIDIYKTDNFKDPIAIGFLERARGQDYGGYYYETGIRITEAYARVARAIATDIVKKIN